LEYAADTDATITVTADVAGFSGRNAIGDTDATATVTGVIIEQHHSAAVMPTVYLSQ